MRGFLTIALGILALTCIHFADAARADTPLPAGADGDGFFSFEVEILDAIGAFAPNVAQRLRKRLPNEDTLEGRMRRLVREREKYKRDNANNPLADKDQASYYEALLQHMIRKLSAIYGISRVEVDGTDHVFPEAPIYRVGRDDGDMSGLSPREKQLLFIPLTDDEKDASGLDDLTPEQKRHLELPLSPDEEKALGS